MSKHPVSFNVHVLRWMSLITGLVMLIVVSTAAASAQYTNPVMDAAREAGLIQQIGIGQTVDDVTVTLDWAYADVQRIVLQYTITTTSDVDPQSIVSPFASPQLSDSSGAMFSYASSYPAPGENANERVVNLEYYTQVIVPGDEAGAVIVDNEYFNVDRLPEALDLELELNLGDYTVPEGLPNAGTQIGASGPFEFDFSVPLYPAITVEPMQTIERDGIAVTLEQVSVTPTNTTARVCYPLPDSRDWQPEVSVEIAGVDGLLTGTSLVGAKEDISLDDDRWCRDIAFSIFYDQQPTELTVSVDYLTASMVEGPDDWLEIQDALAQQGVEIEVNFTQGEQGGGVGIEVVSIPDGVDFNEAVNAARESLGDRLGGPWAFTIEIP